MKAHGPFIFIIFPDHLVLFVNGARKSVFNTVNGGAAGDGLVISLQRQDAVDIEPFCVLIPDLPLPFPFQRFIRRWFQRRFRSNSYFR